MREENVWVGTQGGLLRLRRSAASTLTTRDGAPLSINTIYEDPQGGSLIVAALNGRLVPGGRQTLVPADLPAEVERSASATCFATASGRLWIGTDGQGVARDRRRRPSSGCTMKDGLVNDFVRAFCEDADGGIWIGTDGGLSYWRDGAFQNFSASTGLVYSSIRRLLARSHRHAVGRDGRRREPDPLRASSSPIPRLDLLARPPGVGAA